MKLISSLSGLVLLAVTGVASAQVQKCIDSNGKVLYSQTACPNQATRTNSLKAPPPGGKAEVANQKDWSAENDAINKRVAQREQNERIESNNRAAIAAFDKAVSTPLAPGETRRVTLTVPRP